MTRRAHSLQARLAWRLLLLYAAASVLGVGLLTYRAREGVTVVTHRELLARAQALAASVVLDPAGRPILDAQQDRLTPPADTEAFAIHLPDGAPVTASSADFAATAVSAAAADSEPRYFRLTKAGSPFDDYCGVRVVLATAAGPLAVTVGRPRGAGLVADSLVEDFASNVAWIVPILMALTLGTALLAVRQGLRPVEAASRLAAAIGPHATNVRLPEARLPAEIVPLVQAINQALQRLERGFAIQREFTAHAAHELRTPLAILTTGLENLQAGHGDVSTLRADVARMNRLVDQLLAVARLDAMAPDVSAVVDLQEVAADAVASLAPWAISRGRALSLEGDEPSQTCVRGHADAIGGALRNLIDNALAHSPEGAEVLVRVGPGCSVSVADQGAGVPASDRERIFERFWRGAAAPAGGAGLGLAIVRKVMEAHGGRVSVNDRPGGGSVFTLEFQAYGRTMV
jgi:signal transduction histidine kinase